MASQHLKDDADNLFFSDIDFPFYDTHGHRLIRADARVTPPRLIVGFARDPGCYVNRGLDRAILSYCFLRGTPGHYYIAAQIINYRQYQ